MKNLPVKFMIALALAALLGGCGVTRRLQCGAFPLDEARVKEIAFGELDKRGYKLHRQAAEARIGRDGCEYVVLVMYVPSFPGGHVLVVLNAYGDLKEVMPGR